MKLCIFGAGAVGSAIGGLLARAGHDVTLLGRGPHAEAMRDHGLILEGGPAEGRVAVPVATRADALPTQDLVIVCLKAPAIAGAAADIASLLGERGRAVFALNGIPWWYFHRLSGRFAERHLTSVDPGGVIWNTIGPERALGGVVYLASRVTAPGTVQILDNYRLILGDPAGEPCPEAATLARMIDAAGLPTAISSDIRRDIWHKLWGNIAFNPVTALTHATQDAVVEDYHDTDLIEAIMNEMRFVAEKLGIVFTEGPTGRIAEAARMRGHRTSMLQDIESGRPTEIEAIVGAVREIGQWVSAKTPHLNGLYSLVRLKERFFRPQRFETPLS